MNGRKVKLTGYQVLKVYAANNKAVKLLRTFQGILGEYGLFVVFISVQFSLLRLCYSTTASCYYVKK